MFRIVRKYTWLKKFCMILVVFLVMNYILKYFLKYNTDSYSSTQQSDSHTITCKSPSFDAKNNISMYYLARDLATQNQIFAECEKANSHDPVTITYLTKDSQVDLLVSEQIKYLKYNLSMELFLFEFNMDYFKVNTFRMPSK